LFKLVTPIGERVAIGNRNFDVVGVLEPIGGMFGEDGPDRQVIVPLNQFLLVMEKSSSSLGREAAHLANDAAQIPRAHHPFASRALTLPAA